MPLAPERIKKMPWTSASVTFFVNPFTKFENIQGDGNDSQAPENSLTHHLQSKINTIKNKKKYRPFWYQSCFIIKQHENKNKEVKRG